MQILAPAEASRIGVMHKSMEHGVEQQQVGFLVRKKGVTEKNKNIC